MNIIVKVNCTHNDQGAWCTNKNVKKSLWGLGTRICPLYHDKKDCQYQDPISKPKIIPTPQY